MIKNLNFYDICHEHLSYYSIYTFEKLIKQFNLKVFYAETNAVNGGSIRFYVCKKECKKYDKENFQTKLKKLRIEEEKYHPCLGDLGRIGMGASNVRRKI